ncbi:hypothetical protein RB195_019750 [Necator americanus]
MYVEWWSCDSSNVWMYRECIRPKQCLICSYLMEPDESAILYYQSTAPKAQRCRAQDSQLLLLLILENIVYIVIQLGIKR